MQVLINASAHFAVTPDRALWTPNPSLVYGFWARYLEVFDAALLLVRARPESAPPAGWNLATGPGVEARPLPDSTGPWGFAKDYARIGRTIDQVLAEPGAVQLRIPCHIGGEVWRRLSRRRPYGVEVVGDPYDVFAPGSVRHPLRPLFRHWSARQLRRQCAGACAGAYVTQWALQRRYPVGPGALDEYFSDVDLPEAAFVSAPRPPCRTPRATKLIMVGSLAQLYKAPDVLLDAVAMCVKAGLDLRLRIVGDGKFRPELQARAGALGLGERAILCGQLTAGDPVRWELDQADLFVLASHQEGLPRAMIEAMARALPCIGSSVGGIPELLAPEDLVPPGDAGALARKIREVVTDPERMAGMSVRNLGKAKEYTGETLRSRRVPFYEHVRAETTRWLQTRKA
jgi:glycosyltransferase involved in cell wall biosynthesis